MKRTTKVGFNKRKQKHHDDLDRILVYEDNDASDELGLYLPDGDYQKGDTMTFIGKPWKYKVTLVRPCVPNPVNKLHLRVTRIGLRNS